MTEEPYLTAAQCARQLGLTVRTLRIYEERGLIAPTRTAKNWRLYGRREIARLGEVLALRAAGLSLAQINELLSGQSTDIKELLTMQEAVLRQRQAKLGRSLALISNLRAKLDGGAALALPELVTLAKDVSMTHDTDQETSVAWRRYEQTRPRTEIATDPSILPDYTGTYAFDDGMVAKVTIESGQLNLQLVGQPPVPMFAEAQDAFFLKVVPAQVTFARKDRAVEGLMLHQNGLQLEAKPCPPERFEALEAERAAHAARDKPMANSEATLRGLLEDQRAGQPNYDAMSEPLAIAVREQTDIAQGELKRLGDVLDLSYRRSTENGFDVFAARFENGVMEAGISFDDDGRINGFYLHR